jgi:hypothetical protein
LLKAMTRIGLLQQSPNSAALRLTPTGRDVMRGDERLAGALPVDAALRAKLQKTPRPVSTAPGSARARDEQADPGSFLWTLRVLQAGFTIEQCCRIRQLDESQVLEHLAEAAGGGHAVDADWLLTGDEQQQLDRLAPGAAAVNRDAVSGPIPAAPDARRVRLYLQLRGHLPDPDHASK